MIGVKIQIDHGKLIVRRWGRIKFSAVKADILRVYAMGGYSVLNFTFLGRFLDRATRLEFVMLDAGFRTITLSVSQDTGFDDALEWLKEDGWDLEEAIRRSVTIPLIRIPVSRRSTY
jgi:hypothetical protein